MDQPSRNLPKTRQGTRLRHQAVWTLVVVSAVISLVGWSLSGLEAELVLSTGSPTLKAFLLSHLYYGNPIHLAVSLTALVCLGGVLESRWGSPRFLTFYGLTAWGSSLVTLLAGTSLAEPGQSCGALGVDLGLLVVAGALYPEVLLCRYLPPLKHLAWLLIFLTGAALALVSTRTTGPASFLLPQVSGVPLGLLFLELDPVILAWLARRRARREEEARRQVQRIRLHVDSLLEKISRQGRNSLTREEERFLHKASKHYRRD